jgi:hypothetical protein
MGTLRRERGGARTRTQHRNSWWNDKRERLINYASAVFDFNPRRFSCLRSLTMRFLAFCFFRLVASILE